MKPLKKISLTKIVNIILNEILYWYAMIVQTI
jgi:hypothetical protein